MNSGTDPGACCEPLGSKAMAAEQAEAVALLLKALADPVRLRLMSLIADGDETCVCDLNSAFALSQPTISHHLRVLREAGLVSAERRGTWVYYRPRYAALETIGRLFSSATSPL